MPKLKPKKGEKKSQTFVRSEMHEMKKGKLKSGSGKKVTNRKQAIAIGLNEARKAGGKVNPAATARNTGKPTPKKDRKKRNKGRG